MGLPNHTAHMSSIRKVVSSALADIKLLLLKPMEEALRSLGTSG